MGAVIEFEVFRDHLGVGATDPEVDFVSILFDAINAEIRRLTHRAFEGDDGGSYDKVIRIFGATEFTLPWTPVDAITSITVQHFDGTEDEALDTDRWRLEDAERGLVRLKRSAEYVHVVWTTTGDIPAQLPQAALDWGKERWMEVENDRPANLASYTTGGDSESYFQAIAGAPPSKALVTILGVAHYSRGGVV